MGMIRLLLALSVVAGHWPSFFQPFFFINAGAAVNCFFVISGFYMALVINEKYKALGAWRQRFLFNRALRLYPAYFIILAFALTLQTYVTGSNSLAGYRLDQPWHVVVYLLNFTIIGQDVFLWLRDTGLTSVENGVVILPAWSVASELVFYLFAAALFNSRSGIVLFFLLSICFHIAVRELGYTDSRLVLDNAVYFAMGGLAYLVYRMVNPWPRSMRICGALVGIMAMLISTYIHGGFRVAATPDLNRLYAMMAITIPFVFSLTQSSRPDRYIGELSYPMYLVHSFLIVFLPWDRLGSVAPYGLLVSLIIFSALIIFIIEKPIERIRTWIAHGHGCPKITSREDVSSA